MNMETFHRLVVPAFVVILLTATVIFSLLNKPEYMSFDELLSELQTSENPQKVLQSIHRYLQFQEKGWKPEENTGDARAVADLYFRAGEELHKRREEPFLETVIEFYEKSVQLFPALRHGWPYFNMAEIRKSQNRLAEAQDLYRKTMLYDFGDLSLKAGYWAELLNHQQGKPVDSRPVYAYYRYGDMGRPLSLRLFAKAVFEHEPEAFFMQALALSQSAPPQPYEALLERYLELRPNDYAARFFRNDSFPVLLPEDGRLQDGAYTLNAIHNGYFRLLPDGQLRVDFYTSPGSPGALTIQFELDNPFQLAGKLQAFHNSKPLTILSFHNSDHIFFIRLEPVTGRNLFTLHYLPHPDLTAEESSWIGMDDLHIVLPETTP